SFAQNDQATGGKAIFARRLSAWIFEAVLLGRKKGQKKPRRKCLGPVADFSDLWRSSGCQWAWVYREEVDN
ncbi:MAG: hypothetical protein RL018_5, partial [Pseudomonadota bacterium]